MEIKLESLLSFDDIIEECLKTTKKQKKNFIWMIIIFTIVAAVMLVMGIKSNTKFVLGCSIVVVVCSVIVDVSSAYYLVNNSKKSLIKKNEKLKAGIHYDYTFFDDRFEVSYKTFGSEGKDVVNYSNLTNIQINNDSIFLYINQINFYVVKISNMNDDEKKLLLDKLNRYIKKK